MRTPAEFLASRVEAGDLPSAVWLTGERDLVVESGAVGSAALEPARIPATTGTVYDLASLTKPLVTTPLVLLLDHLEGFGLDSPVRRFLPSFAREDKRDITLIQLLTHTSGLRDWEPLYLSGGSIEEYVFLIGMSEPVERPGRRVLYSDLGYIALGAIIERIGSSPLDELAASLILSPLGSKACFRPPEALKPRVAPTEASCNYERRKAGSAARGYSGWREGVIHGAVHDQNAWAAGGVAGHAGLFGTAEDAWRIARELTGGRDGLLRGEGPDRVGRVQTGSLALPRTAAWRVNRLPGGGSDPETAAGEALPEGSLGHNGFTGTSIWIEAGTGRVHVLLTNRVHPEVRAETDMNAIRRGFHRIASTL